MTRPIKEALSIIAGEGFKIVETRTRKHLVVRAERLGYRATFTTSVTPSDRRTRHRLRSTVRREVRRIDCTASSR